MAVYLVHDIIGVMKKSVIILATHGAPPRDFPRLEMAEFFNLHSQVEAGKTLEPGITERYQSLENRMRQWPRNERNDPFYTASASLAAELENQTGIKVLFGFNEFCGPDIGEAIDNAVSQGADNITVVTPMLTRGGNHAEIEIAGIVNQAVAKHPEVRIIYAWPFETADTAGFLARQVQRFNPS